ncbi:MAG: thioredoxin family protein [Candidatus Amulumruptor caecigallinarius]|nr:thioredoxin family protein [Candidatus Amulumruptor caecigallinarius]
MTYAELIESSNAVVVEFYASWCPHCQRMMPIVAQVKELLGERVNLVQLDIDENKEAANEADVQSIPTFIVYKNGKQVWRQSGEMTGEELLSQIQAHL